MKSVPKAVRLDPISIPFLILGVAAGYGIGRYLWASRRLVLSLWPIVALLAIAAAALSRLFGALALTGPWQTLIFPLLVGWGAGLAITPARLPRQGAWWELWKT